MTSRSASIVYLLFLLSGATALVYEVAWLRRLALVLGAGHEAVALTLAVFMAGLALGGVVFGRMIGRVTRPLRLYGILELAIAAWALVLPFLLAFTGRVGGRSAVVVLLPPTILMGGTLPVLVRYLVVGRAQFGGRLSRLYAVNTLGAVLGVVGAAFLLLPVLGLRGTEIAAVAVNAAVAVVAFLADRGLSGRVREEEEEPVSAQPDEPEKAEWGLRLAFLGTAVAGFGALTLEVAWTRAIAVVTGSTTYGFSIMLAAFLLGLAVGSWLLGRRPIAPGSVVRRFGMVMILIGVFAAAVSLLIPRLPEISVRTSMALYGALAGLRVGTILLLSFLVMLVPTVFMGMAFPLAGMARAGRHGRFASSAGDLVGLNTLGAIAGATLAGFVLIPGIGLQRAMLLAAGAYLGWGLLVLLVRAAAGRPAWIAAGAVGAAFVAACLPLAVPQWDIRLLAQFQNNRTERALDPWWAENTEILYYREGRASTVSVIDTLGERAVLIDGKSVATDAPSDMEHEYLLGHLPVLLHPAPRSVAVVGLGAGLTLGGVVADPGVERVVVLEIEPAVLPAARLFHDLTDDALDDPRVEVVIADGRKYLAATEERFDVITADPIHPWARGAANLYTTEYFRLLRERLKEGGLVCQWLPLYELSETDLKCVIGTFADTFPHTELWQATYDTLLIGSLEPVRVDPERLAERMAEPSVKRQLDRIGLVNAHSFLMNRVTSGARLSDFAAGAPRNTDDNLFLEFSCPWSVGTKVIDDNVLLVNTLREGAELKSRMLDILVENGPDLIEELYALRMEDPDYGPVRNLLARRLYQEGNYKRALEVDPGNAGSCFQLGVKAQQKGDLRAAIQYYERALARRPHYAAVKVNLPKALRDLGLRLLREGETREAIPRLRRSLELNVRPEAVWLLADALARDREFVEALSVLRDGLEIYPEDRELLARFAWLRATVPDPALRDGEEALAIAERLLSGPSSRLILDAHAAALAEVGRFEEAAAAAERAGLEDRARSYRERRPWRQ